MKKILFVINTMDRAGAEMALLELLRCLEKQEELELSLFVLTGQGEMLTQVPESVNIRNKSYDSCSVLTAKGKRHLMKTSLRACFVRGNVFRRLPYLGKVLFDMIQKKRIQPDKLLWRIISDGAKRLEEEYDLAVAYLEGGSTYYVMDHVKAKKKVAFYHTDYRMAGYTRYMDQECYLHYDRIFAISDAVKEVFLSVYPECKEQTEVFYNIINRERILKLSGQSGGFSDDFNGIRILTVGRLTAPKDFAQSIQAMKLLKERKINARWYILGEGDQRTALEALIKKLNLEQDFFLPGAVENPYTYLKQADLYVHATRYEGKSVAIQEAQVLGKPILASNCSGNKELVISGVDGLLCDLTPEAICDGIITLLSDADVCKQYGEMAAKRQMTESKEVEKLLSMLK